MINTFISWILTAMKMRSCGFDIFKPMSLHNLLLFIYLFYNRIAGFIWIMVAVFLFLYHTLDGIDGKQVIDKSLIGH